MFLFIYMRCGIKRLNWSKFEIKNASTGNRKVFNFHKSEIPILVRRLEELGTPEADQWADDIQNYDKNIQEIAENL